MSVFVPERNISLRISFRLRRTDILYASRKDKRHVNVHTNDLTNANVCWWKTNNITFGAIGIIIITIIITRIYPTNERTSRRCVCDYHQRQIMQNNKVYQIVVVCENLSVSEYIIYTRHSKNCNDFDNTNYLLVRSRYL